MLNVGHGNDFAIDHSGTTPQGIPYDYTSIMHLHKTAFSIHQQKPTIVPALPEAFEHHIGPTEFPTSLDYLHINILYCGGNITLGFCIPECFYTGHMTC